jgi:hypothetical protein
MFTSAYFVTLETRDIVGPEEYTTTAAALVHAIHNSIGSIDDLCVVMHASKPVIINAQVEVEVMQSSDAHASQITARALVRVDASKKLAFDKNKFSVSIRNDLDFPISVAKRVVSKEELAST